MRKQWILLVLMGFLGLSVSTQAATVTYTASYGVVQVSPEILANTNWSTTLSLPLFDPSLGTLTGISFTVNGKVRGNAKAENTGETPDTLALNLQASITLTDPSNNTLVNVIPVVSTSDNVAAFDGIIDWAGTSGVAYTNIAGNASQSGTSNDFVTFTGVGNILLPLSAAANSYGSGGNALFSFQTSAAADASITYTYTPAVPLPAASLLGLPMLAGLVLRRRQRA